MASDVVLGIDFEKRFPHRYWVSSWTKSAEHPLGVRYKLLSTRLAPTGPMELVVVVEEPGGARTEMNRIEVSPSAFDKAAAVYVDGLAEEGGVHFFALDLTRCRSFSEYDRILGQAGWNDTNPASAGGPSL